MDMTRTVAASLVAITLTVGGCASVGNQQDATSGRAKEQIAADVDATLRDGLGIGSYHEACGSVDWACVITEITAGGLTGNVEVHVSQDLTKAQAETVAKFVLNFTAADVPDVEWVIVVNPGGLEAGQLPRSASPAG